jgi:hypothetical protein
MLEERESSKWRRPICAVEVPPRLASHLRERDRDLDSSSEPSLRAYKQVSSYRWTTSMLRSLTEYKPASRCVGIHLGNTEYMKIQT